MKEMPIMPAEEDDLRHQTDKKYISRWRLISLVLICVFIWYFNTGTLAPYAATLPNPVVDKENGLLGNWDDSHFEAVVDMLQGKSSFWKGSVMFRRPLHPWLYLPFSEMVCWRIAGVVLNLIAYLLSVAWLWADINGREGGAAAFFTALLLATYPGFAYWCGQPYCYGLITPGAVVCFVVLRRLARETSQREVLLNAVIMGVVFLAYDLYIFFLPASVMLLACRGCWARMIWFPIVAITPLAMHIGTLTARGISLSNSNSDIYSVILRSYFETGACLPGIGFAVQLVRSVIWSQFLILPLAMLMCLPGGVKRGPSLEEMVLGGSLLVLFCFLNLAPKYDGWQMRGDFINRIYQPGFVVLAVILGRAAGKRGFSRVVVSLAAICQAAVCLSGVLGLSVLQVPYEKFYPHADSGVYEQNLRHFGRRPLGFTIPPGR